MRLFVVTNILAACLAATAQTTPAAEKAAAPATEKTTAATKATPATDPVVITIGDEKITKSQYEALIAALPDQLKAQATGPNRRKFAEQVVEMKTLAYEGRRRKLDQQPDVQERIALQKDNVIASEMFRVINTDIKVDPAAVQSYYDQHKQEYETLKASHILIRFKGSTVALKPGEPDRTEEEALAKAKEVRAKILAGGNFAEIAKAESDDTGSGANGGSLGAFGHGRMVPAFEQAAFALPPGQVSDPVKSQFGYHIIKVEEHNFKTLDEVRPQIETQLKPELAKKAVEQVKKGIPVVIDDQYFGK